MDKTPVAPEDQNKNRALSLQSLEQSRKKASKNKRVGVYMS